MNGQKQITRRKSRVAMLPLSVVDVSDLVKRIVVHGVRVREVAKLSLLVCKGGWSEAWRSFFNDVTQCAKSGPAHSGEPQLESLAREYAFWRVTHLNGPRGPTGNQASSLRLKLVSEQIPFAAGKIVENPRALLNEMRLILGKEQAVSKVQLCVADLSYATARLTKVLPETTVLEPEYRFFLLAYLLGKEGWNARSEELLNACYAELEKQAARNSCMSWRILSRAVKRLANFLAPGKDGLSVDARRRYALRIVRHLAFAVKSIPCERPEERHALLECVRRCLQRSCEGMERSIATPQAIQNAWTRIKRGVREEGWLPERFHKQYGDHFIH